ncbi:glutaredoxin 2 [Orbus hercynius]|uniref:Glutaredoxin 2 n=1 Tax=Orbus hercynius TaxID=593135 RepID=A0A495RJR2_9GAMM|nr:glutaredoxin 2 [Orbus hercynius]RKS87782.1 glutaredoxin 2 [Orbus hercynius]
MKLFVYDHCPFCVRTRMIFGLKKIPFELVMLANDDDETPTKMIGQKMVPILQKEDGTYMPESLDIVEYVDQHYGDAPVLVGKQSEELAAILAKIQAVDYILVYPRYVALGLPEFQTHSARDYFENKKKPRSGPFSECLQKTEQVTAQVEALLAQLDKQLKSPQACNGTLSIDDICLFPTLRNLTCVQGLTFPPKVKIYLDCMAKLSQIDLYFDRAL